MIGRQTKKYECVNTCVLLYYDIFLNNCLAFEILYFSSRITLYIIYTI